MNSSLSTTGVPEASEVMSVADLVARLAVELTDAAAQAGRCQEAVGEALGDTVRREAIESLQQLDELTQRLQGVAGLLERLAAGGRLGVTTIDVIDGLTLSDLKARLRGETGLTAASDEPEFW